MFIYVMKKDIANKMSKRGFNLVKEDELNSLWVFEADDTLKFSLEDDSPHVVFSDILSF